MRGQQEVAEPGVFFAPDFRGRLVNAGILLLHGAHKICIVAAESRNRFAEGIAIAHPVRFQGALEILDVALFIVRNDKQSLNRLFRANAPQFLSLT